MAEIKVVKLINGDEIIGKMSNVVDWNSGLEVEKPRLIAVMQTGPGAVGVALLPWSAAAIDGTITIRSSAIMTDTYDASNELEKQYLQQTSGIAIASGLQPGR